MWSHYSLQHPVEALHREWEEKRGNVYEQRLREEGNKAGENNSWTLLCPLPYCNQAAHKLTCFPPHHSVDVPPAHFSGTKLNYPKRSDLCFITRQNKELSPDNPGTRGDSYSEIPFLWCNMFSKGSFDVIKTNQTDLANRSAVLQFSP